MIFKLMWYLHEIKLSNKISVIIELNINYFFLDSN